VATLSRKKNHRLTPRLAWIGALLLALSACTPDEKPPAPTGPGLVDAGPVDAGSSDAGSEDAGAPDAGPDDAGVPDAGPVDAGPQWGRVTGVILLEGAATHDGIAVSLLDSETHTVSTDGEGRFTLEGVSPGAHTLVARKEGYGEARQVLEVQADGTASVSLTLRRLMGQVRGTVTLEGGASPEAIAITLSGTALSTTAAADGTFVLTEVPVGTYTVIATKDGYVSARASVGVTANGTASVVLTLERPRGGVRGTALLEGASSHEGITVRLVGMDVSATTDANGGFVLERIPTGTYLLVASRQGYDDGTVTVDITAGGTATPTVNLLRPGGRITGTVQLQWATNHAGVTVSLADTNVSVTTDASGSFTLERVSVGSYTLVASKEHYAEARQSVTVVAGSETPPVDFTLTRTGPPTLSGPFVAVQGGQLAVTGSGFGAEQGGSTLTVGGVDVVEYVSWSDDRVVVRLPHELAPGAQEVVLTPGDASRSPGSKALRVIAPRTVAFTDDWGMGIRPDSSVVQWGGLPGFPPGLTGVVSVAAGTDHALAVREDGTVVAWGHSFAGNLDVPAGLADVVAVAAGEYQSLALKADGTVVSWGFSFSPPPAGLTDVVAISSGAYHALALKADGTVVGWGNNDQGQASAPANLTDVVAVSGGVLHSLAVKADGTVVGWGNNLAGQASPPASLTDAVDVAAGFMAGAALRQDGRLIAWGNTMSGPDRVPASLGTVVSLVGIDEYGGIAIRQDGTLATWGGPDILWTPPPSGLVVRVPYRPAP
jgi:hypothetical protein